MLPGGIAPPIATLPPSGVMPTLPGGVAPPIGALPPASGLTPALPGGIAPPIATLPPTGVMPTQPGGVAPPIGALPPASGLTPALPGGIAPPIATLPPTGVMPTLPGGVAPPIGAVPPASGLTPTLPGGIAPPIATLPPAGVMPTLPGGVAPPIGALPPASGLTPALPGGIAPPIATLPPAGVMPTQPGGVAPPIGALPPASGLTPALPGGIAPPIATLPPTGVMPTQPGGVAPPIGVVPPASGLTPERPGGVTPPVAALPPASARPEPSGGGGVAGRQTRASARLRAPVPEQNCLDPRIAERLDPAERAGRTICRDAEPTVAPDYRGPSPIVPITTGRDLGPPSQWNAWTDTRAIATSDQRHGLDVKSLLGSFVFGVDRSITEDTVAGLSISLEGSRTRGFDGFMKARSNGVTAGPYVAYRLSPNWAIDASLTYGAYENTLELSVLEGSYLSQRIAGSVTLHGQYTLGEVFLRPKAVVTYSNNFSDAYRLSGRLLNIPINLRMPDANFNYGLVQTTLEISRLVTLSEGTAFIPYFEVGAQYEFDRPDGGQILTGDLSLATPSRWSYSARGGVRALISSSVQVEASAGYLSFGQQGLDVWEGRLNLSYRF
ncbi:hypothetical protein BIWAKO_06011 [Bosea sp. BIWAKO-01]|nr:hypothetical protein BIWAKO_06011 [Bosea sp. BIWAKO-01]